MQVGSFPNQIDAEHQFDLIKEELAAVDHAFLRVEKIGAFYVTRIGKFDTYEEIRDLLTRVRGIFPSTMLLQGYFKPERFVKLDEVSAVSPTGSERSQTRQPVTAVPPRATALQRSPAPQAKGKKYHTLQLASFADMDSAAKAYYLAKPAIEQLGLKPYRVEKINKTYALRAGLFSRYEETIEAQSLLRDKGIAAMPLSAYFLADRIQLGDAGAIPDSTLPENIVIEEEPIMTGSASGITEESFSVEEQPGTPFGLADEEFPAANETAEPAAPGDSGETESASQEFESEETTTSSSSADTAPLVEPQAERADEEKETVEEPEVKDFALEFVAEITTDELGRNISFPTASFVDPANGESYILTGGKGRIVILGQDFFPVTSFGRGRGLDAAQGGTLTDDGRILLAQTKGNKGYSRLTFLNRALLIDREINLAEFDGAADFLPSQVAYNFKNETIYVCGLKGGGVMRLDKEGNFLGWLTVSDKIYIWGQGGGDAPGENVPIIDLVSDSEGYLYLLSEETGKIYVYDREEKEVHSFGTKGGSTGKLSRPRSLAIDERRRCIFVVDYMRHTVLVYDLNGLFVNEFGGKGWSFGWFNYPSHIDVLPDGKVIIADFFNHRVQAFSINIPKKMPAKDPVSW